MSASGGASSAATAPVRSVSARQPALIAAMAVAQAAIVADGVSGARFVGNGDNASSMSMAIAAGMAPGAYALVLFISGGVRMARS